LGELILYLHNDPTPPQGDTESHDILPMDGNLPGAPILYNYDVDRDDREGLLIVKGGSSPDELDNAKHQHWLTPVFPVAATVQGDAAVKLWTAMKDFGGGKGGAVTAYLRDCDGSYCVELGSGTAADANWQHGTPSWVLPTLSVPIGTYTLAPGHSLELVVVVDASSDDDMWFAYDTNDDKSRVTLSATASPLAESGADLRGFVTRWLAQTWPRGFFT